MWWGRRFLSDPGADSDKMADANRGGRHQEHVIPDEKSRHKVRSRQNRKMIGAVAKVGKLIPLCW
jgi:hypothetical protein